jgi:glycosyltransferase involved in cell wall biosynthesis
MKIAYITAGAAGMYCGTCLHDNTLAGTLMEMGHEVSLTPLYTSVRTDESSVAVDRIFFGAINIYLQQKLAFFRHTPRFVDRLFDNRRLLDWVARVGASSTKADDLGALTLSMLEGERGHQQKELNKLVRWLGDFVEPEIVHLSHSLFSGFGRLIKQELGVPVVCSLSGEDLFYGELEEPYRSKVLATLAERAQELDAFTAPCQYYADLMGQEYGIPPERIFLNRLGINPQGFGEHRQPRQGSHDLVLGYLARFCPEKGTHQVLEAFRILTEDLGKDRLRLRVAGYLGERDRAFYEEQRRLVEQWGLDDRIDFVGELDLQGKFDFLSSLDLFTMPTLYREPKGIPVLEALMSGVPVVQPRHGAFPEWIEHTGGGILVDPESPQALAAGLRSLIQDPALRQRLGQQGQSAARKHFNHHIMAEETLGIYHRVLEQTV